MFFRYLAKLCLLLVTTACTMTGLRAEDHTTDKLDKVLQAVKAKKAVLVDVREVKEWDKGHLKDAKLIPLSGLKGDLPASEIRKLLPKDAIVYCHCASGFRCLEAAPMLRQYGYEVRALSAGYKDLLKAGFSQAPQEEKKVEAATGSPVGDSPK
jgi:phage shock protein E